LASESKLLTRQLFNQHAQAGDLGPDMGHDVLGMGQVVAQGFKSLNSFLRYAF